MVTFSVEATRADKVIVVRHTIEQHLFRHACDLLNLTPTVTLYDITNTYFEGEAGKQPNARRGHSKEKRTDCPLLTLGLALDASGLVRRARVLAGNVREHQTLETLLTTLGAPAVVLDRGIATEDNLIWLRDTGYRYLAVSRARHRTFDMEQALVLPTAGSQTVHLHLTHTEDECRLYCYSPARAEKEKAMATHQQKRLETGLQRLADGLSRPRGRKHLDSIHQRIGRLREQCPAIAPHYQVTVIPNADGTKAQAIAWTHRPQASPRLTYPGVYCLRSTLTGRDADKLWRTYTLLGLPGCATHPSTSAGARLYRPLDHLA